MKQKKCLFGIKSCRDILKVHYKCDCILIIPVRILHIDYFTFQKFRNIVSFHQYFISALNVFPSGSLTSSGTLKE